MTPLNNLRSSRRLARLAVVVFLAIAAAPAQAPDAASIIRTVTPPLPIESKRSCIYSHGALLRLSRRR